MNINNIDINFLNEGKAVIFGTLTYLANTTSNIKNWLDNSCNINLEGKIGVMYAASDYIGGGADTTILTLMNHLIVKGMLLYSGGSVHGKPFIHLGYVSVNGVNDEDKETPMIFGERIAKKVKELF